VHTQAPHVDFLAVDAFAKYTLVEKLARSRSLASAESAGPSMVDQEQVAIAEVGLSPCRLCYLYFPFFIRTCRSLSSPLPER